MEGFVEDAKKLGKPGESDFIKVLERAYAQQKLLT
jgi:hypothetical protein